jgi:cellulose biosynthesis protein BcsQ
MKVVASYNIKGGVGKTAIALNLADAAVSAGYRTLLWDLDEQGGAGAILGRPFEARPGRRALRTYRLRDHIEASAWPGLDLLPADKLLHFYSRHDRVRHLSELLERIEGDYDRVVLDCPPTLGDIAEQIFELADLIVVPLVPSTLSMNAYEQLQAYREAREGPQPELLPVFSMVDKRRRSHRDALDAHTDRLAIPYASAVEQMATRRLPIARSAPRSPAAQPLALLWDEIEARLGPRK